MLLAMESSSANLCYAYLSLKNTTDSMVEVTGYYVDRYESVGVFLRIPPKSSEILGVQTHLLAAGKEYSVYVRVKGYHPLEGPFKIQLPTLN